MSQEGLKSPLEYPIGLMVIDVQEKLFPRMFQASKLLLTLRAAIQLAQLFNLPTLVTEQYPEGLGSTILPLSEIFSDNQKIFTKTAFSAVRDSLIYQELALHNIQEWVLVGIETHICILQTAKDLLSKDSKVTVLKDATSCRSESHCSTALQELRECGARISSVESFFYEIIKDSKDFRFKEMLSYIKLL